MISCLSRIFIALIIFLLAISFKAKSADFYVSIEGKDSWSGKLDAPNAAGSDGPFATLTKARDSIRALKKKGQFSGKGVTIEVRGGTYRLSRPLWLGQEDSGSKGAPIVYSAHEGEDVCITGGVEVADWQPVGRTVAAKLKPEAQGKVYEADLRKLGIEDFGSIMANGLELFFNRKPMMRSRWPNQGYATIKEIVNPKSKNRNQNLGHDGKYYYSEDNPNHWQGEKDLCAFGFWCWDWADDFDMIKSIDTERKVISLAAGDHHYGYRATARYCVFNAFYEIDCPGEYKVDYALGKIYFWPPSDIENGYAEVSLANNLLVVENASFLRFRGLTFESSRNTLVNVKNGKDVCLDNCILRNTGGMAANIDGGFDHALVGCDITGTAYAAVMLYGGDRDTLTPSNHLVENCHIWKYARWKKTSEPGVDLRRYSCGGRVRHNLIHDAPHEAIYFSHGNNHLIEFNEIHNVCLETDDCGAIYAGRDWAARGTVIRYNYFHNIPACPEGKGIRAIYFDDANSGNIVFGNLFADCADSAVHIGGGRDNIVQNNIFVNTGEAAVSAHAAGRKGFWLHKHVKEGGQLRSYLERVPYKGKIWRKAYPSLVGILDDDEPGAPKGNIIRLNYCSGTKFFAASDKYGTFDYVIPEKNNLELADQKKRVQIKEESPYFQVPQELVKKGFKKIPFSKIGMKR